MKSLLSQFFTICVSSLLTVQVVADSTLALTPFLTHREQAAALNGRTRIEKVNYMRAQVLDSRYGQRGLQNLFKGFERGYFLDPEIPGVTKNLTALNSLSWQQAKGAVRTLLYATKSYQDHRFYLEAVDQPVNAPYGRTDKDLVLRHRQTGQRIRIEVKDANLATQRSDFERIKGQIDKMAAEYRRTGELQAWVNRQETIPAIKEYARQKGVPIFEKTKQTDFTKVLDDLERRSITEARVKLASGALSTGAGIALLYTSTIALWDIFRSNDNGLTTNLRISEQIVLFVGGTGFTASGVAQLGSRFARTESALAKLGTIAKWGGRAGIIGVIVGEGLSISVDYSNWDHMTARQQSVSFVQHGVSMGGMAVAFGMGFLLGIETGPVAVLFGLAAAGATYAAAKVATNVVEDSYNRLDDAQKQLVRNYIYRFYGIPQ